MNFDRQYPAKEYTRPVESASTGKGEPRENAIKVSRSVVDDLNESHGLQKSPADKRNRCSGYVQASEWEQGPQLYWLCEESLSNESVNEPRRSFSFCSTAPFSDGFPIDPVSPVLSSPALPELVRIFLFPFVLSFSLPWSRQPFWDTILFPARDVTAYAYLRLEHSSNLSEIKYDNDAFTVIFAILFISEYRMVLHF